MRVWLFLSEWLKKNPNLIQHESRGCQSQNGLASSSARVVDVLERCLKKRLYHLSRQHQNVLCSKCPSADVRRGKERSLVQKGLTDMRAYNEARFTSCLSYARVWAPSHCVLLPPFSPRAGAPVTAFLQSSHLKQSHWGLVPAHHSFAANPPVFSFRFFKHPIWPAWVHKMLWLHFVIWFAVPVSVLCWPALPPTS